MAKIDNAVRIVEFESENDLYSQMENDLNTYFNEEYSKCFKLKNFQLIDKNHAKLLETVYSILQTLLSNIDMYRKIETEFVTSGEAATSLRNRLKDLRSEINRIKAEMHYADSDFTFMYYTR